MEREDWETVRAIMDCRAYRQACRTYEDGKLTKDQSELLARVDQWRREEEEGC